MSDLTAFDAATLSTTLEAGSVGAAEVMAATLDRIERLNPKINAIVSMRPRDALMAEARAAEREPRRGWLHGVPFAVKDLVETAGIRTTRGSPLLADHVPDADDLLAARLRGAGAILIGKTNVPEFGLGSHSYNPVHGVTRNPYDLSRSAGGSRGGGAGGSVGHGGGRLGLHGIAAEIRRRSAMSTAFDRHTGGCRPTRWAMSSCTSSPSMARWHAPRATWHFC